MENTAILPCKFVQTPIAGDRIRAAFGDGIKFVIVGPKLKSPDPLGDEHFGAAIWSMSGK